MTDKSKNRKAELEKKLKSKQNKWVKRDIERLKSPYPQDWKVIKTRFTGVFGSKEHYISRYKNNLLSKKSKNIFEAGIVEGRRLEREERIGKEIEFLKALLNEKTLVANTYLGKFINSRIVKLEELMK